MYEMQHIMAAGLILFLMCFLSTAMLQEAIGAAEEKNEMEELKQLLPDIREKVEDAKESQRTARAASQAIQQTLVSKCVQLKGDLF